MTCKDEVLGFVFSQHDSLQRGSVQPTILNIGRLAAAQYSTASDNIFISVRWADGQ